MFDKKMGQKKVEKVERIAKGAMREFGFRGIDLFSRLMVKIQSDECYFFEKSDNFFLTGMLL